MGKIAVLLLLVLVVVAIIGASMGFRTDGQGSNPVNNGLKCAYGVQQSGGSILDVIRVCNPVASK